jgi:NAD(P)-dependent dehydrogenase (short-subunit alcohol dehydrogenase family)
MTKTWFITGTSSGFGRLLTEQLLERGDRVAATLRRPEALDDLRQRFGEQLWTAQLDVTDTPAVYDVVGRAFDELGRIDVVVNNAGYGLFCAVEEAGDDQIRDIINTNVIGSMQVIRAALPNLRAQGGGRILQVSSAGGQTTYPNFSYYHASKWAIEGFAETIAREIAPFGIGLTIIEPGATGTSFASSLVTAPLIPEYDSTPPATPGGPLPTAASRSRVTRTKSCRPSSTPPGRNLLRCAWLSARTPIGTCGRRWSGGSKNWMLRRPSQLPPS